MWRGLLRFWLLSRLFGRGGNSGPGGRGRGGCGMGAGCLVIILVILLLIFLLRGCDGANMPTSF